MALVWKRLMARMVVRRNGRGTGATWLNRSSASRTTLSPMASHSRQLWMALRSRAPGMADEDVRWRSTSSSTGSTSTKWRPRCSRLCSRMASSADTIAPSTSLWMRLLAHAGSVMRMPPFAIGRMSTSSAARSSSKSPREMSSAHSCVVVSFAGSCASSARGRRCAVLSPPYLLRHSRMQFSAVALGSAGSDATVQRSTTSCSCRSASVISSRPPLAALSISMAGRSPRSRATKTTVLAMAATSPPAMRSVVAVVGSWGVAASASASASAAKVKARPR
mmetsp:Transcript_44773/g.140400  ORF Transcript_44773/g.140400 Transcript_44773/m.140400 type:complete len:278 (-) Transcript_44773:414-1247(-)